MICKNCLGKGYVISPFIYPNMEIEIVCPVCNGKKWVLFNKKINKKMYKVFNGIALKRVKNV
jgi:excinuclease UvrABC ATPase subunit